MKSKPFIRVPKFHIEEFCQSDNYHYSDTVCCIHNITIAASVSDIFPPKTFIPKDTRQYQQSTLQECFQVRFAVVVRYKLRLDLNRLDSSVSLSRVADVGLVGRGFVVFSFLLLDDRRHRIAVGFDLLPFYYKLLGHRTWRWCLVQRS